MLLKSRERHESAASLYVIVYDVRLTLLWVYLNTNRAYQWLSLPWCVRVSVRKRQRRNGSRFHICVCTCNYEL